MQLKSGGKNFFKKSINIWFCLLSLPSIIPLHYWVSRQPTWYLLFWNMEITELEDWVFFFLFREHTWQSHISVLGVLNCSKLSGIFRQKSYQSHNNCRLKHTSYPKAIIRLGSVIILFIYHGTMFLWWSGGLLTHIVATNLHHFKVLSTVSWCRGKLCSSLPRKRSSLAACTGALLVKKRVKRKIK